MLPNVASNYSWVGCVRFAVTHYYRIWFTPKANQTSLPPSAVAHLQRMAQEAAPRVHQTLPSAASEDKRTPFAHLDRSTSPFVFHVSGSAEYSL